MKTSMTARVVAVAATALLPLSGLVGAAPKAVAAGYADTVEALGPSAYYQLSEATGPTATDSSGNADGTYQAAASFGAPGLAGVSGDTAVSGDGTGPVVTASDSKLPETIGSFDSAPAVTIELWFNIAKDATGQQGLLTYGAIDSGPVGNGVSIEALSDSNLVVYEGGANVIPVPHIYDGNWHLLDVSEPGGTDGTFTAYLDGQPVGTGSFPAPLYDLGAGGLHLGAGDSNGSSADMNYLHGTAAGVVPAEASSLDQVAIYPSALSADQVQEHFTLGATSALTPGAPGTISEVYTARAALDSQGDHIGVSGMDWSAGHLYVVRGSGYAGDPGAICSLDTTTTGAACNDLTLSGPAGTTYHPNDAKVGPGGVLYFTSMGNPGGEIDSVPVAGGAVTQLATTYTSGGQTAGLLMRAGGWLAFDSAGHLYASQTGGADDGDLPVVQVDTANPGPATALANSTVKFDSAGILPMTDDGADASGLVMAVSALNAIYAYGVAADTPGMVQDSGTTAQNAPSEGAALSTVEFPLVAGITSDPAGDVFVMVSNSGGGGAGYEVWEIYGAGAQQGTLHLVAGSAAGTAAGSAPAGTPATSVRFTGDLLYGNPLTVDSSGNLYVADGTNVYEVFGVAAPAPDTGATALPAPSNVQASNDGGTVSATWDPATGTGSDQISAYLVTVGRADGTGTPTTQSVPVGSPLSATFSGLDPSQSYAVVVQSTDSSGDLSAPAAALAAPVVVTTFTLSVTAPDGATVSCQPEGAASAGPCESSYPSGTTVLVTATPPAASSGDTPVWSGCDSPDTDATCGLVMTEDRSVSVTFQAPSPPANGAASLEVDLPAIDPFAPGGVPMTVTAKDANGDVVSGYDGTVHFTSSDPAAVLPPDYTFTGADAGTHTFQVVMGTAGSQTVTATDVASSSVTGTSSGTDVIGQNVDATVGAPGTATGVVLQSGQKFSVSVLDGRIGYGPDTCAGSAVVAVFTDAAGNRTDSQGSPCSPATRTDPTALDPSAPLGALIGRIGTTGPWFLVGSQSEATAAASGPLYLAVNDSFFTDNSGAYAVQVGAQSTVPASAGAAGVATGVYLQPGQEAIAVATGYGSYGFEATSGCTGQVFTDADGNRSIGDPSKGAASPCEPAVKAAGDDAPLPGAPIGALIGRIGSSGAWFPVGTGDTLTSSSSDQLHLTYNDDIPADNTGGFTVWVYPGLYGAGASQVSDQAPPPPGVPLGALDPVGPAFTYDVNADNSIVDVGGDGTLTVDVPKGALPDKTVISVDTVDLSKLSPSTPPGSYVAGIAVSWQAPGGTHPDTSLSTHVTLTIRSTSIHAGDPIFQLNPDGTLTQVGTATDDGVATVTFTSDPTFLVGTPAPAASAGGLGGGSAGGGTDEAAGATYASAPGIPSASVPVVVKVTTPVAGTVSVGPATGSAAPSGFEMFGQAEQISAPAGTAAQPLVLTFEVDRSALPAGADDSELTVTRDGAPAGQCRGATTIGSADPCVTSVVDHGSYVSITVLSTHASTWSEVAATADRIAGADRIGTAVATSQEYFGAGAAKAAVVARDDSFADALAGDPLAAAKGGPLLLSDPSGLPAAVGAELTRALVPGSTVYLLGGTAALSPAVDQAVAALGFTVVRLAGPDRYATAVAVAGAIGTPSAVLLANGQDFPDALAAGAAASRTGAVVLLSAGGTLAPATAAYLSQHPKTPVYAIGGPAAAADPQATPVVGADRYATAVAVAERFFPQARAAGLASGLGYADALSAGAVLGADGEPLLLTDPHTMSPATASYIQGGITELHTFGGPAAVAFNPTPALSGPAALARFLGAAVL